MKKILLPFGCLLLIVQGCKPDANCYSNISNIPNPMRSRFLGNFHYRNGIGGAYDISITIPPNSNGNFVTIPWQTVGVGQTFSTKDTTCELNNSCKYMSTGSVVGKTKNDSLFITEYSPDAMPPDFIKSQSYGVKY